MKNAYQDSDFAQTYLEASHAGRLRDHAVVDPLVLEHLETRLDGARVLDIGCGDGRWAKRLLELGASSVVGVEPASPMARAARARCIDGLEVVESAIEDVEFEGRFDHALASMSLDHVEAIESVLANVAEHLVPGGLLLISTEHPLRTAPRDGHRWHDEADGRRSSRVADYGHAGWRSYTWFGLDEPVKVYHRPLGDWVRALRDAGFALVDVAEPVSTAVRDGGNPRFWLLVAERHK